MAENLNGDGSDRKAVLRSQQSLIVLAVMVAVVGAVVGTSAAVGSAMIAFAVPGILGGGCGLLICRAVGTRGNAAIRVAYSVLLVIGLLALTAFFSVRAGRTGPDIGLGGVLMLGLLTGLPGAFGTGAIIWTRRRGRIAR
ncbi:hypothetical protein [Nocardia sp. CC227C]|uniref:hypothetical protein n=1 Tax=Nocardia sp. CC227C TaxID=3044562 RepID=UPI00278BF5AF|nr:hypothetical protein [Nocardia sp. CC227C]